MGSTFWWSVVWLFSSREFTNLTHDLTTRNRLHLAHWVANLTGQSGGLVLELFEEIEQDIALREHIARVQRTSPKRFTSDHQIRLGRRLAWYALVRILRPTYVVETGTDKGLGTLVLTRAVEANDYGQVVSIDINPKAGAFCRDWPDDRLRLLNGDSVEILRSLKEPEVDLFVHDSLHTYEYEAAELRAIGMKLSPGAFVLSDNSRDSDALLDWSLESGRQFHFFQEMPAQRPYVGEGVGVSIASKPGLSDEAN